MTDLVSITAIAGAAAITPGPNNALMMSAAARHGLRGALPVLFAIAGTAGGMVLVGATVIGSWLNADTLAAIMLAGGIATAVLALLMWRGAGQGWDGGATTSVTAVLVLQAVNPKAWILALTMAAAARTSMLSVWTVAQVVFAVSSACLLLWGLGGTALARLLHEARAKAMFDRAMAALLFAGAVGMILSK